MSTSCSRGVLVLLLLSVWGWNTARTQSVQEGTVTYRVQVAGADARGEMSLLASFASGSLLKIAFREQQSKFDIIIGGGMIARIQVLNDLPLDAITMLFDVPLMQQRSATRFSVEEVRQQAPALLGGILSPGTESGPPPTIKYYKRGKRTVAGYKCRRADMRWSNGESCTFYLTDRIKGPQAAGVLPYPPQLKGFPLAFEYHIKGMDILITAQEVDNRRPRTSEFEVPDDYTLSTPDELMRQWRGEEAEQGIGL